MSGIMKPIIKSFFEKNFNLKVVNIYFYHFKYAKSDGCIEYISDKTVKNMEFDLKVVDKKNYNIFFKINSSFNKDEIENELMENKFYVDYKDLYKYFYKDLNISSDFINIGITLEIAVINGIEEKRYNKSFTSSIQKNKKSYIPIFDLTVNKDFTKIRNKYIANIFLESKFKLFDSKEEYLIFENNEFNSKEILSIISRAFIFTLMRLFRKSNFNMELDELYKKSYEEIKYFIDTKRQLEDILEY